MLIGKSFDFCNWLRYKFRKSKCCCMVNFLRDLVVVCDSFCCLFLDCTAGSWISARMWDNICIEIIKCCYCGLISDCPDQMNRIRDGLGRPKPIGLPSYIGPGQTLQSPVRTQSRFGLEPYGQGGLKLLCFFFEWEHCYFFFFSGGWFGRGFKRVTGHGSHCM